MDISFSNYVRERQKLTDIHLEGGIPDYAYATDLIVRQKIKAIPGVIPFFKALTNQVVPLMKQKINLQALRVGPSQFPDIYEMAADCAKTLGIGIPTVFVMPEIGEMNSYTYAMDDEAPIIVIYSSLLERFSQSELKTVIGHECGHIHNNHSIFEVAATTILDETIAAIPIVQQVMALLTMPLRYLLMAWSRAAEVTCDRAGIICSSNAEDIISADVKLMYGGTLNRSDVNIDAVLKQYDTMRATPVRFLELDSSHPTVIRRIFAEKEFINSDILYKWRPEWKKPNMNLINKQELDARCEKYISVTKSGKRS
jgi:Zn-dependent protease with chaperone function